MLSIQLVLALAACHWFGDFYMQSRKEGNGKSKDNWLLTRHVLKWTAVMAIVPYVLLYTETSSLPLLVLWLWVNGLLHWVTDYVTSRCTRTVWAQRVEAEQDNMLVLRDYYEHRFWAIIGLDQLIHAVTIYSTASLWLA